MAINRFSLAQSISAPKLAPSAPRAFEHLMNMPLEKVLSDLPEGFTNELTRQEIHPLREAQCPEEVGPKA